MMSKILTHDGTRALLAASEISSETVLEGSYKSNLQDSVHFQTVLWPCVNKRLFETMDNQAVPHRRHRQDVFSIKR